VEYLDYYFGVDLEKIWLTIKKDLPTLFKNLQQLNRKSEES